MMIALLISNAEDIMAVPMWRFADLRRGCTGTGVACWICGRVTTLQRAARAGRFNAHVFQKAFRTFVQVPCHAV